MTSLKRADKPLRSASPETSPADRRPTRRPSLQAHALENLLESHPRHRPGGDGAGATVQSQVEEVHRLDVKGPLPLPAELVHPSLFFPIPSCQCDESQNPRSITAMLDL